MRNTYLQMCDYGSRFRILKGGKISLVVSAFFAGVTLLHAAPSGGVVTSGTANIAQNGAVTTINQSSQKASINWTNFSIGASETVNFNQPNVSAIALNRVVGNEKSIIDGALNANGQVWILNSNGVLFNSTAKINTSGLLATTKSLSDEDFQTGNYIFKGESSASVINLGEVTINNGGYASFLANTAQNEGVIKAIRGVVTLTGANEAVINLNGNSLVSLKVNKGVLDALVENKGAILAEGGKVYLTTNAVDELLKGVVNNTGIIEAKSIDDISSEVVLYAHGGTTNVSGTIDASGGFVETSGHDLSVANGTKIKAKKWLLDPENVTIDGSSSAVGGATVGASVIEAALAADESTNVSIEADNDINVNQAISWSANTLTLNAGHSINVNAVMAANGTAELSLNYDADRGAITMGMNEAKTDFVGKIHLNDSSTLSINGASQTIIRSVADLQDLSARANMAGSYGSTDQANALKGNFVLASDINMLEESWTPIGKYSYNNTGTDYSLDFKGKFNGLGHTVSNLTISGPLTYTWGSGGQAAGLFGNIATHYNTSPEHTKYVANISGVRLLNASVTNTYTSPENSDTYAAPTAALVGAARDNSELVRRDPTIPQLQPIIHNNIVTGSTIQTTGDGSNVAGIVGEARGIVISGNAVTNTTVSANKLTAGGIVAYAVGSTITDSYVADSTIKSAFGKVGGVAGYILGTTIDGAMVKDSTIQATSVVSGSYGAGGIVGTTDTDSRTGASKIKNAAVEGSTIAAMQDVGGIIGRLNDSVDYLDTDEPSTVTNSFYNLTNTKIGTNLVAPSSNSTGVITLGAADQAQYEAWRDASKVAPSASSLFGAASNGYYSIDDAADFRKMMALAYDSTFKAKLSANLALASGLYLPLFKGELDGNGKTISGLNVSQEYNSHIGLVGRLMGGTVKNLTLSSPTLDGYAYVGGVAGYAGGGSYMVYDGRTQYDKFPTISNVSVTGFNYSHTKEFTTATQNINTEVSYIGGIAGFVDGATLSNLSSSGSIAINLTANNAAYDTVYAGNVGGLLGVMYGSTLDTAASSVAINIGLAAKKLEGQDIRDGNEAGAYSIGGAIGSGWNNSLIKNVTASGAITISAAAELLPVDTSGENGQIYIDTVGGLFGEISDSYIKMASSTNTITTTGNAELYGIGGITGDGSSSLYDGVTTSGAMTLTGVEAYNVGGMLGSSSSDIIKNATSTRNITITTTGNYASYIGGLVGEAYYSNIDTASYTGTIDIGTSGGENIGGLVGYNYGEIDDHEYADFGKVISATTTQDNLAQRTADTDALRTAYNARADVVALKALGYTVDESIGVWGQDPAGPYHVNFNIVTPDNAEWGVIKNSTATVNIKAQNAENVGGLVGYMDSADGGAIVNSSVSALNGTGKVLGGSNVGGLVGYNYYGNITGSHASIEVVGNTDYDGNNVGGLVGYNEGASRTLKLYPNIQDSYAIGELTFANTQEGQTAAQAKLDQIRDTYIEAMTTANPGFTMDYDGLYVGNNGSNYVIGGYLYLIKDQATGVIKDSYATGKVTGGSKVGGLVGYNYSDDQDAGGAAIISSHATGQVEGSLSVGGLVGYNEYASILDSRSTSKVIGGENSENVGGLVGYNYEAQISESYASGEVAGYSNVGGLVGYDEYGMIDMAYSTGKVTATGKVMEGVGEYGFNNNELISTAGGFVGEAMSSTIENSYATGEVVGKGMLGGFAGVTVGADIAGSYATGKVTGTNGLGGFVGLSMMSSIEQSYASGMVDATATTGVGGVTAGNMVAGFVAQSVGDNISESYTTSNVTGATNVGGFAGKVSTGTAISNTYARGSVTASGNNVGSFAGALDGSTVKNSYASGKIKQTGSNQLSVKGFVGNHDGNIINSFYDKTVNAGLTDDGSNVGKTTTELKTQSTYTTALGDGAWDMGGENGHYPILGFQVDGAESIWVMAEGPMPVDPTPTPVPTPTPPIVETPKIIDAIASGIAVQPPVIPNFTPPPLPSIPQQFSFGGQAVQLMSTPLSESPTQIISLGEIRQMQQENASGSEGVKSPDIRIPLGQNSLIQLVNGGLRLPEGIEQEFFMAQR